MRTHLTTGEGGATRYRVRPVVTDCGSVLYRIHDVRRRLTVALDVDPDRAMALARVLGQADDEVGSWR